MDYFTSDWNLNHFNIIKYQGRPFKTTEEMNQTLIDSCNKAVGCADRLFFLGGFLFGPLEERNFVALAERMRNKIKCENIFLIYGNHDRRGRKATQFRSLFSFVGDYLEILSAPEGPGFAGAGCSFILSHYPIEYPYWNRIKEGSTHLHGHTYKADINMCKKERKLDVGVDCKSTYIKEGHLLGDPWSPFSVSDVITLVGPSGARFS